MKSLRNAKGMNRDILDELGKVYPEGLTDERLAARLHVDSTVSGNNVAKRRSALTQKGLVVACKEKELNSQGNKVTVWKLYFPPTDNIQPRQYEPEEKAKHGLYTPVRRRTSIPVKPDFDYRQTQLSAKKRVRRRTP